jgi:hypothetical protein
MPLLLGLVAGIPVFLAILIIELLCYFVFTYDERPETAAQKVATG